MVTLFRRRIQRCVAALIAPVTFIAMTAFLMAAAGKPSPSGPFVCFGNAPGDALKSDGQSVTVGATTADYANGIQNVLATVGYNFRFDLQGDKTAPPIRCMLVDSARS